MAEIDKKCVEGDCFAINDKTHGSGNTDLNIVYKANYTGQICTARFKIKSKDGSIVKEYMIAQDAKPVFYNIKMVQPFTKDDCMANEHGTVVLYTVEERTYKSFISQEDADAKAMEDIALNGQAYANEHGKCITDIWYNEKQSKVFTRNNCDEFSDGQPYTYIVPAGKYVSSISQADANKKAIDDINTNGQATADLQGECKPKANIYYGKFSKTFTRNNCDSTQYGTGVVVDQTMVTGDFRSVVSQADANNKAKAAVEAQGQDIANIKGNCEKIPVFTGSYSKIYKRQTCPPGSTPIDFTVDEKMCVGYPFTSTVSQADANDKAKKAVEAQGQDIANERGGCDTSMFYNVQKTKVFTRNNCDEFSDGQPYTYIVPAGKYSSVISQADADSKATDEINEKGQVTANLEGECKPKSNIYYGKFSQNFTRNNCDETQYGTTIAVDETMVTGDFRSVVSQADANKKAEAAVKAQGQDIANIKGSCEKVPVFTGTYSRTFTRNNCASGGVAGTHVVNERMVDGYPFTSTVSQADANNKAKAAVDAQGQAIANANAKCTFTGSATLTFTRNNCAEGYLGSVVTVTQNDVTGRPFTSTESQAAANTMALAAVQAQGQGIANSKGTCTERPFFTGEASFEFTRNNCGANKVGVPFTVTQAMVTGGPFKSYNSQEEANLLALAAVMDQGQAIANQKGTCKEAPKYTGHYSESFDKNNCPAGLIPSSVTVNEGDVTGGPFYSYESQFAADELAKAAVKEQGQAIANSRGTCDEIKIYVGNYSKEFTPVCPDCQYADAITVNPDLMGQFFTSTRSQEEADAMAKAYIDRMGQAFVNKNYDDTCHTITQTPVWETVETVCKDCISQLRQRNTNTCYTGSPQERHIAGGTKTCFWWGVASKAFTRQCADGGVGSSVTVTQADVTDPNPVAGGKFKSCVSQADANAKALAAVTAQGQTVANTKGTCTWTGQYTGQVQRKDCADGGVGSMVSVNSNNLPGYPDDYKSNVSLADANNKAKTAVNGAAGQAYANKNGDCTWTHVATRRFYKNNCVDSGVGQAIDVTSTQANGGVAITSKVSLADAKDKAEKILDSNGQAYANTHGTCLWTGTGSATFYKNDCGSCKSGVALSVSYSSLGLAAITSTVSQADANAKVTAAFSSNTATRNAAQAYANKNGNCQDTAPVWGTWTHNGGNSCNNGDVWANYKRTDSTGCHEDETDYRLHESCGCGCSGGSCDSCCDPTYRMDDTRCYERQSQEHYVSDCDPNGYWRDGGEHCCYDLTWTIDAGEFCKGCNDGCGDICLPLFDDTIIRPGEICKSTQGAVNEAVGEIYEAARTKYQNALATLECPKKVGNDDRWGNVQATNCPSNCTAKTISYKQAAGKYDACSKGEANKIADDNLQADGVAYANGLAQADRCNCTTPLSWTASVEGAQVCHAGDYTGNARANVSWTNNCSSDKTLTIWANGNDSSGQDVQGQASVTLTQGTGHKNDVYIYFSKSVLCESIRVSGSNNGSC